MLVFLSNIRVGNHLHDAVTAYNFITVFNWTNQIDGIRIPNLFSQIVAIAVGAMFVTAFQIN